MTLCITDTQHKNALHYAECHSEYRVLFIVMLNVIMLTVIMLNAVMLNAMDPLLHPFKSDRKIIASCFVNTSQPW
jgi:hypothetical protein